MTQIGAVIRCAFTYRIHSGVRIHRISGPSLASECPRMNAHSPTRIHFFGGLAIAGMDQGSDSICDFRAMPSLSGPVPSLCWSGTHPSQPLPIPSAVLPATPCSHLWSARLQPTLICDFRAVPARKHPSQVWEAPFLWSSPSCGPSQPLFSGPRDPLLSFVVRAAAANVNPRTRLSHMTEIPPLLGP
jgi:hypothetical protein